MSNQIRHGRVFKKAQPSASTEKIQKIKTIESSSSVKPEPEDDDDSDPTKPRKLYDVSKSRLPLISVIDDQTTLNLARDLLVEAKEQDDKLYAATVRLKEIKAELIDIAKGFSLPGFRHGDFGIDYLGIKNKKTLNKNRLIEKGVSPEDIADCYVDGKPFDDARFKRFLL